MCMLPSPGAVDGDVRGDTCARGATRSRRSRKGDPAVLSRSGAGDGGGDERAAHRETQTHTHTHTDT